MKNRNTLGAYKKWKQPASGKYLQASYIITKKEAIAQKKLNDKILHLKKQLGLF
jgi:hypothetical protein